MAEDEALRLLTEFREKAEPLGISVLLVGSATEAARAVAEWANSLGAESIVLAEEVFQRVPSLAADLEAGGLTVRPSASPEATRDAPMGVSLGRLAIAETGSALLSEPSLEDRSV